MKTVLYKIKNKLQNVISRSCNILYEKIMRKRLKNKEFSIVCPNCIGGGNKSQVKPEIFITDCKFMDASERISEICF